MWIKFTWFHKMRGTSWLVECNGSFSTTPFHTVSYISYLCFWFQIKQRRLLLVILYDFSTRILGISFSVKEDSVCLKRVMVVPIRVVADRHTKQKRNLL